MLKDREIRLALKIVLTAAAVYILFHVLVKLAPVISLIVIALFIVYTISPLVNFLISIKIKPLLAGMIASLLILFAVIMLFYLLIPGLILELRQMLVFLTSELIQDMPTLITRLDELDQRFNLQLSEIFIEYTDQFIRQAPGNIQQLLRSLTTISMGVVSQIWVVFALVFLVFYMVRDIDKVKHNLTLLFPRIYKENIVHLLSTIDEKVGAYIRGTLLKCIFVGILTWLGLSILGMPFALMLGILAGALNIILYVGPVMAAIPALLLAIMPDTPNFFLIALVYIIVQILDAFVFTPFFLGKATDLSPLTVIVIVLIGAQLMGLLGIILAIPITATLKVLLFHYYLEKRQNESTTPG
ncbi:MAG TPA: AI-2E family transporter [Firmicutes bacterium]|nr:AI-2E family transporter [Bacillota bacterium]